MRLTIPMVPFAVVVRLERRRIGSFRLPLRRAMLLIAVIAVLLAIGKNVWNRRERRSDFENLAFRYDQLRRQDEMLVEKSEMTALDFQRVGQKGMAARCREGVGAWKKRAEYHERLAKKYRLAADWPVLPVLPIPPDPPTTG